MKYDNFAGFLAPGYTKNQLSWNHNLNWINKYVNYVLAELIMIYFALFEHFYDKRQEWKSSVKKKEGKKERN